MSTTDPQSPFRSRGFVVAAIVVGAIALAAIVVLVTSLLRGGDNTADPTPAPTSSTSSEPGGAEPSVCGLEGFEETSSLDTAPDNEWELVGTVAAPTDPDVGPGTIDSGFRSCYAHTAEGSLFAAVTYVALASDSRNIPRLVDLVEPGPGRDAAIAAGSSGSSPSTRVQVAGFKINSYSADEAVVDVAWSVTSSGGALVSMPVVLHWVEGDWKIVLDDDGQPPFAASPLDNLGGYIPWAGV